MPKKNPRKTLTLSSLAQKFPDEESAWKYLESILWSNGIVCPHCGAMDKAHYVAPKTETRTTRIGAKTYRRVWWCAECRKEFSVLVGTIFEDSKIPLRKWMQAALELAGDKNGISSHELARKLDITQKSAWHLAHRIRFAFARPGVSSKLQGTVEADETYFGGEAKNMHKAKRERAITGRGTVDKVPVFSIVERGGEVRSQVMENVNGQNVKQELTQQVDSSATLNTDTSTVYPQAGKEFAAHQTVDHSAGEYVRKTANGKAHVNTAEGHFSQLKRSIDGTHHHVSEKHLPRYLAEFDYRYTTRTQEDGTRFENTIKCIAGKRLTYKETISRS